MVTFVTATVLATSVRQRDSLRVPAAVLAVGATYLAAVLGGHGGPLSAAVVGLALLLLALTSYTEIAAGRRLPTQTVTWSWRSSLGVLAATAVLDLLVAVVSGGGRPVPSRPSALSLAVACVGVSALVVAVTALADGVALPRRLPAWWNRGRGRL